MRWIKVKGRWKALSVKTVKPLRSASEKKTAEAERVVSAPEAVERTDRDDDVKKTIEMVG